MKKKILALVLTLAMVLSLLPATALATGENEGETPSAGSTIYVDAKNGNDANENLGQSWETAYKTLATAVTAAKSGDTIILGEGNYTLYGVASKDTTKGKDLTFIGQGAEETGWNIGAEVPNPDYFGTEYNGDYSFDGAGTVTFQNMTLRSGAADYLGFIRANNTVVENCIINGKTFYWGYQSAMFKDCTFNCPPGDYALWTYSSPVMTFDGCNFNSSGKVINVYTDYGAGKQNITVNYKDCTVNSSASNKPVLNVNDFNMGDYKYIINISGKNEVHGIGVDKTTCSRLFGFGGKAETNNKGKTIVKFGDTVVWQDGKMVDKEAYHNKGVTVDDVSYNNGVDGANNSLYAEGYKDNAVTTKTTTQGKRTVTTKTCNYCGWSEESSTYAWDVSRSKEATNLDSNYESKVTLSLPSTEENLATDVVLAMDVSWYTDKTLTAVKGLLNDLSKVQQETGANIKIGISMFKGCAVPFQKLVTLTPEKNDELQALFQGFLDEAAKHERDEDKVEAVKQAVRDYLKKHFTSNYLNTGTNMPAGLLLAKQMLDQDSSVKAERKYMVLVSDGSTYLFIHDQDYTTAWSRHYAGTVEAQRGGLYENNWRCMDFLMSNEASPADWTSWLESVAQLNESFAEYDYIWKGVDTTCPKPIPLNTPKYLINGDTSIYQATAFYKEMQETGYNCYYCYTYDSEDSYGRNALKSLNDDAHLINAKTTGTTNIFSGITKDIIYLLGTGSTVKDEIGSGKDNKGNDYNFDFVDKAEAMTLTVGKTTYVTKKADAATLTGHETSRYLFKAEGVVAANQAEAPYVLHYYQKGEDGQSNECFVWDINVNVSNFDRVQLTYTIKLTNPQSQKGTTYGVYDRSGEKQTANSSLYTNLSATLKPVNSNGVEGADEAFLKPTVSYTIKSGGHSGGGTVTIPDDVPTGLNGKDHYAYVVGYPDGMVYPQKNITRAEVATIFFRLLTDETREANMTKSNSYNDMKDGAWYTCAVSTLSKMGIIKGYEDGSFKPDASISRAEFAAIAARFDPDGDKTPATFSDVSSHWAKDEISIAANHGWIKGYEDGSFKPDQKITRAETMTLVNRVLKRLPETKDDLHKDMKTWPDNQNESAWFYLAVQEATNSHYQNLKKDGTHEKWESMRETRDWAALEK